MKKVALLLMVILVTCCISPTIASASPTKSEAVVSADEVTLFKRIGNVTTKKKAQYMIQNGKVKILHSGDWYQAQTSNMSGYDYMVDFGGRNNVWYFNL